MLPREHGAYAQIALPLVAALASSEPTVAGACLTAAACAAFTAHEPALVLLGHRGTRARREKGPEAGRRFVLALALVVAGGLAAFVLAPAARPWMAFPAGLATASAGALLRKRERTLGGEILAAATLASVAVPVVVAGGLPWQAAVAMWAVFSSASAIATVEVRSIARRNVPGTARAAAWTVLAAVALLSFRTRPLMPLALVPVAATVTYFAVRSPPPAALRRLGWTLVGSTLAMTAGIVLALRV